MADAHYLSQTDAELAVGGASDLREHFKVPRSTEIDPVKLDSVLRDVDGDIRTAIGMSFDLNAFDAVWFNTTVHNVPPPNVQWTERDRAGIVSAARKIVRLYIWQTGTKNQAVPEMVVKEAEVGRAELRAQGMRLQSLSTQLKPATSRNFKLRQPRFLGSPPGGSQREKFRGFT